MKKILSVVLIVSLLTALLPAGPVLADTESDIAAAEGYIDAIAEAAPTVESYVFSEELADQVDGLADILRTITDTSAIEVLDAYVAEKTTVVVDPEAEQPETHTYFTSVKEFSRAYADRQKEALKKLSGSVGQAIQDMLSAPLTRENYALAQGAYDDAGRHVRDAVDGDLVNALNQIHELFDLVRRADNSFSLIEIPTKNSDADDFDFFMEDYQAAETSYGLYESKFASLRPVYYVCLQKDIKNALFENYDTYAKAAFHAEVEDAYDQLGVYDTFDDEVKEKMQILKEAVAAGQESKFRISVYDYYRGEEIQAVLEQYRHLTELETMMALISDVPANKTELTAAMRAYRYYNEELTEEERSLVPAAYADRLKTAVLMSTNADEIMTAIEEIGAAASEEEYEDYLARYEKAYKAYRLFVNTYSGLSDIASLITNVFILDDATEVIEMIRSIRQIEDTEDALMCSQKLQMESVISGYERMAPEKQAAVYNIERLRTIYADASAADAVRRKIDVIIKDHSLLDEQYAASIREDYEKLSETAKRYLGTGYLNKMLSIERDMEALNLNKALRVSSLIDQIGTVGIGKKTIIETARNAYDGLTEAQKALVPNYEILSDAEKAFSQLEFSVAKASVSQPGSYPYTGRPVMPVVNVELNGVILTQDLDYRLTYASNTQVGTARVTVTGIGDYTGTITKNFTIRPAVITGASLSGFSDKYVYTGKAIRPSVKAFLDGKQLKLGTDYSLSYKNNKKRGAATVTVTGIGNYTGTAQAYFQITRSSIKKAAVSGVNKAYFKTGKAIRPKVKVKVGGKTLKKKRDYKVTYKKNVKRGKAVITIKGKGNYTGSRKIKFRII